MNVCENSKPEVCAVIPGNPFNDVIFSERTPKQEREIANHPSLKPQSFLRQVVYAALPLGEGILLGLWALVLQ
ncbi:MAG: hypothetical protein Fur0025_21030 [Oscillatoriaceae cyanobacterium]